MDRRLAFNGKSLDAKGDVSSVRALLLQKWYEITFAKIIYWNLNDEIHPFWWENDKLVEKDNQAREFESEAYSHFWLHNCGYLNMNRVRLLFLEFDLQMTKIDKVWQSSAEHPNLTSFPFSKIAECVWA